MIYNKIKDVIKSKKGAYAVFFALLMPLFISLFSLAIDGNLIMAKRARMADGINQAAIALVAIDNRNKTEEDKAQNIQILKNYLGYYSPNDDIKLSKSSITVIDKSKESSRTVEYLINSTVTMKTLFNSKEYPLNLGSFSDELDITSSNTNSGNARKVVVPEPIDIALVVDFSRSMREERVADGTTLRIDMLQNVVEQLLTDDISTASSFAIIPFDIGVSEASDIDNAAKGKEVICSTQFVPKKEYKINYGFWSNKFIDANEKTPYSNLSKTERKHLLREMDDYRYSYFRDVVLRSYNGVNTSWIVVKDLCEYNDDIAIINGKAPFSCWENDDNPFMHVDIVEKEYDTLLKNLRAMRFEPETSSGKGYESIMNIDSIDVEATLDGLFDTNNIIRFRQPWAPNTVENRAFGSMCQSGTATSPETTPNVERITAVDAYRGNRQITIYQANETVSKTIAKASAQSYVIPLTTNHTKLLSQFLGMKPGGGTDSTSGLMRGAIEVAKGTNPKKIIIVISDGADSPGPQQVADLLHKSRPEGDRLCDRIRKGLGEESNIYFISIAGDDEKNKERVNYWGTYCTGPNNAMVADSENILKDLLVRIVNTETGYYFNK